MAAITLPASLGLPAIVTLVPLTIGYFAGLYVLLQKIPLAGLGAAEVGTSSLLALIGGGISGLAAALGLGILQTSPGFGRELAEGVLSFAKGRLVSPQWVVFLSTFALSAVWILFVRARRYQQARERSEAEVARVLARRPPRAKSSPDASRGDVDQAS